MLRMQYSLAIVRMVNGIADSSQRGRVAASVASLAAGAGLPRALVDLRHEATHNELPSLAALRLAALHALTWLEESYWRRQGAHVAACLGQVAALAGEFVGSHLAAVAKEAAARDVGCGDDSGNEGDASKPGAGAETGYDAAGERKRRQGLLTELKAVVPRPAAPLLVDALQGAVQGAATASGADVAQETVKRALSHLTKEWPQLPALLLHAAAAALAAGAAGGGANEAIHNGAFWSQLLLPSAGSPAPAWRPTEQQAAQLLAACLPAHATAAHAAALHSISGEAAPADGGATDGQALLRLLQALLGCVQGNKQLHTQCAALLATIAGLPACSAAAGTDCASVPAPQLPPPRRPRGGAAPTLSSGSKKESRASGGGRPRKRWRRAAAWAPCAIGMLPSASDPNGQLPCLDLPHKEGGPGRAIQPVQQAAPLAGAAGASRGGGAAAEAAGSDHLGGAELPLLHLGGEAGEQRPQPRRKPPLTISLLL